jgi:Protein of unknown function (DUF2388).
MKKMILMTAAVLSMNAVALADASDDLAYITFMGEGTTSSPFYALSYSFNTKMPKVILEASEDINAFVASEGVVRTVRFENALNYVKSNFETTNVSDLEIAQELLSLQ